MRARALASLVAPTAAICTLFGLAAPAPAGATGTTFSVSLTKTSVVTLRAPHSFTLTDASLELVKGRLVGLTSDGSGFVEIQIRPGEPALTLPVGTVSASVTVPRGVAVTLTVVVNGTAKLWLPASTRWHLSKPSATVDAHLLVQSMTPSTLSAAAVGYAANPLGRAKASVVAAVLEWPAPPITSVRTADACSGTEPAGPCESSQGPGAFNQDVQYLNSDGGFGLDRFIAGTTYDGVSSDPYVRGQAVAAAAPPFTTALLVAYGQ